MPDTKVSADPLITAIAALTDYLPIISGGVNKRIAVGDLFKFDMAWVTKTTTNQLIAVGSHVKVTFNVTVTDPGGYWSASNNAFVIPANKAGLFVVLGQVQWPGQSPEIAGYRFIDMLNATGGSTGIIAPDNKITVTPVGNVWDAPGEIRQQVISFGSMAVGDSVALYAEHDNANHTNTVYVQASNTWFALIRLGKVNS